MNQAAGPSGQNPDLSNRKPQFDFDSIFRKIFSNAQVAHWLLSTDTEPPTVLTPDMMKFSITADSLFLGDKDQATYFFKRKDAEGNTETTAAENIVFVCHHCTDTHAYLTMTDSRTPFSFLEPPAAVMPGVRRAVAERCPHGLYLYVYYWLADGRSNLGFLAYQFEPKMLSEKHILLLAQYPPSRYPQSRDVLEGLVMFEQSNCQFCLLRGYAQCECTNQIASRSKPVLPAMDQRNPWSLWAWTFGSYEAGLKKYFNYISSYTRNVQVELVGFNHITPTFMKTSQNDHVQGYRHYLNTVRPCFRSKIQTWGIGSSFDHHGQQQRQHVGPRLEIEYSQPIMMEINATMGGLPEALDSQLDATHVALATAVDRQAAATSYGRVLPLDASTSKGARAFTEVAGEKGGEGGAEDNAEVDDSIQALAGQADVRAQGSMANLHVSPSASQPRQPGQSSQQQPPGPEQTLEKVSSGAKYALDDKHLSEQQKLVLSLIEEIDGSRGISGVREDCRICGASFSRKYELKRHLKSTHLELRDFECPICSSKFKRRQHLDTHHQQVHEKNKGMLFHCHFCDKSFTADSSRRRHVRSVHSVEASGDPEAGPSKQADDAME